MSNDIVKQEQRQVATVDEQVIKDFLFGSETKLTDEQKVLFGRTAMAFNLNPFKREIYAVPFEEKWYNKQTGKRESFNPKRYRLSIVTGYEVYLKRAERLALLDGWKVWTEDDPNGRPIKAKISISRKDWKNPFEHEVYFNEYAQSNSMWESKPHTMIKKVVTAQGFRMAFPDDMGGLPYTSDELPDEMGQVKVIEAVEMPKLSLNQDVSTVVESGAMDKLPIYEAQTIMATETNRTSDILYIKYNADADSNYYTEAQHNLILKLLDSHCLTPLQKLKYRKVLKEKKVMSKVAGDLIEWLTFRIKVVKKAEDHIKEIAPDEQVRRRITGGVLSRWEDKRLEDFIITESAEDYREINDFLSDIKEVKDVAE